MSCQSITNFVFYIIVLLHVLYLFYFVFCNTHIFLTCFISLGLLKPIGINGNGIKINQPMCALTFVCWAVFKNNDTLISSSYKTMLYWIDKQKLNLHDNFLCRIKILISFKSTEYFWKWKMALCQLTSSPLLSTKTHYNVHRSLSL
jgi:hypothetical protein